ncbi:MAG: DUF4347 domain-containing protein, partial [Desulfuromonas sp.]|nr:DUF4347 domain-containing protein [Desulfuromonas sp.]
MIRFKWFSKRQVFKPALISIKDYSSPFPLEPRYLYDASGVAAAMTVLADAAFEGEHHGDGQHAEAHDGQAADFQADADRSTLSNAQAVAALVPDQANPTADHAANHTIIIVDPSVPDKEQLLALLGNSANVHILNAEGNGLDQIQQILAANPQSNALHLLSHGGDDMVQLGSTQLSSASVDQYAETLQQWGTHLSAGADILFYGCAAAESEQGQQMFM